MACRLRFCRKLDGGGGGGGEGGEGGGALASPTAAALAGGMQGLSLDDVLRWVPGFRYIALSLCAQPRLSRGIACCIAPASRQTHTPRGNSLPSTGPQLPRGGPPGVAAGRAAGAGPARGRRQRRRRRRPGRGFRGGCRGVRAGAPPPVGSWGLGSGTRAGWARVQAACVRCRAGPWPPPPRLHPTAACLPPPPRQVTGFLMMGALTPNCKKHSGAGPPRGGRSRPGLCSCSCPRARHQSRCCLARKRAAACWSQVPPASHSLAHQRGHAV